MKHIKAALVFLAIGILFSPTNVLAERWEGTGFFTNLDRYEYEESESKVLGFELYIAVGRSKSYKETGYTGFLLELMEGYSSFQAIIPTFEGDNLTFEYVNGKGEKLVFKGIVDTCGLTGNFHRPDGKQLRLWRLKRKGSYWN